MSGLCISPSLPPLLINIIYISYLTVNKIKETILLTWSRLGGGMYQPHTVVERHGLDVERTQNGLLVYQMGVIQVLIFGRQNHTHITEVHIHSSQVSSVQRGALKSHITKAS